jgi:von Willebrand factor type A domain
LEVVSTSESIDIRLWSDGGGRFPWLFSLALHVAALVAMGTVTQATPQGGATVMTREGGIVLVARHAGETEYFQDQSVTSASFVSAEPSVAAPVSDGSPPPALLESVLPAAPKPANQPIVATPGLPTSIGINQSGTSPGRGGPHAVETQVFGVRGKGSRFVYVFDRSSSMEGAPLAAAKRELIASLQSLQGVHQFQIIFYNEQPQVMPDFRGRAVAMVSADEPGKHLAARFVGSVFAHGATDHMQALRTALQMRPDVLFLLTDANEPQLRAEELVAIRQLNQGTSINAIEFGVGPPAPLYNSRQHNFLQQLAAENGGQHTYVDVTRLR